MTKLTPRQVEINMIAHRLRANAHAPGDRARLRELVTAEVTERLKPVLDDLQAQLPAIEAAARRRAAIRREAIEAGRRAGIAAGREAAREFQQRRQTPMSAAQRQARDRVLRQQQKR